MNEKESKRVRGCDKSCTDVVHLLFQVYKVILGNSENHNMIN